MFSSHFFLQNSQTTTSLLSMCLLGYPSSHRGYKCYDLSSHKIILSRHVIFDENTFPFSQSSISTPHEYNFLEDSPIVLNSTQHTSPPPFPLLGPPLAEAQNPPTNPSPPDFSPRNHPQQHPPLPRPNSCYRPRWSCSQQPTFFLQPKSFPSSLTNLFSITI